MPIETNLNRVPYFDDFDPNDNYYRILFRPGTAVQARELTQLQSIHQDQIEKFGKHVFVEGSIVDGCTLSFDDKMQYVKITDEYTNGSAVSTIDLEGKYLIANSNLRAYVQTSVEGSEGTPPDFKSLYIKYTTTGTYSNGSQQKLFDPSEILTVATAANVTFGVIQVANSASSPVGNSYSARITDGVIFQKGTFIRVPTQTTVVSKYDNIPDGVSLGFKTNEEIITPEIDTTLLDNAQGSYNYNAPGAHRLKLTPVLVTRTTQDIVAENETSNTQNFFSIADFENGKPARVRTNPEYAKLGAELAKRTYEESGNYIVDPFELRTKTRYANSSGVSNTSYLNIEVDKGLGYVFGYRVEYQDKKYSAIKKGTDTVVVNTQIITANFGNYINIKEMAGTFDINNLDSIDLIDVPAQAVTKGFLSSNTTTIGNTIGTASIRTIKYDSGTPGTPNGQYKAYIFNLNMNSGKSFSNVRSIYAVAGAAKGFADVTLSTGNVAVIQESDLSNYVIPLGQSAVKNLRDASNTYSVQFNFRTSNTVTFTQSQGSIATLNVPTSGVGTSGQELPYGGGTLSGTSELDFIVVATNSANTANLTGTVTTSGNTVTGTSTDFNNVSSPLYIDVGDFVLVHNTSAGEIRRVTSVANTTYLTVNSNFTNTYSGAKILRHIPTGSVINMTKPTANIQVGVSNISANIYPGSTLNKDLNAVVYYNLLRSDAVGVSKVINKNRFVKLDLTSNTTGPWCLGLPDVVRLRNVYFGEDTGTAYSNTNPIVTSNFILESGQKDSLYDLSYLRVRPGSTVLNSNTRLLVELDHFTHNKSGGVGFISIESYPIDDANTSNSSAITTQEIPRFRGSDGTLLDLRDCIDFRPIVANTANSATTIATATVNPSENTVFDVISGGAYSITPDETFTTDFSYYLGRIDKIALSPQGQIVRIAGIPSLKPAVPKDKDNAMTLGTVIVPPYPSLPMDVARSYGRTDYGVLTTIQQNKRFTMRDIGVLEQRIERLEYYTTLSLLEINTQQTSVRDASGNDRFKNGFLVDPFNNFDIAHTTNQEFTRYSPALDRVASEILPRQQQNWVELDYVNSTSVNVVKQGSIISLQYNSNNYITQPSSSKVRNCSEGVLFSFKGRIQLDPSGDHRIDTTRNPLPATIETQGLTTVRRSAQVLAGNYRVTVPPLDTTISGTSAAAATYTVGSYVTDVSVQPYLAGQVIRFQAAGMRPNTIVYPFFDNIFVGDLCQPTDGEFLNYGALGGTIQTNNVGNAFGLFYLPAGRFLSGDRIFKLLDIRNQTTEINAITTEAYATYFGSNINITKQQIEGRTRPAEVVDLAPVIITLPTPEPPPPPPDPQPPWTPGPVVCPAPVAPPPLPTPDPAPDPVVCWPPQPEPEVSTVVTTQVVVEAVVDTGGGWEPPPYEWYDTGGSSPSSDSGDPGANPGPGTDTSNDNSCSSSSAGAGCGDE